MLLSAGIIPLRPDFGYYINVQGVDISEEIFPEEFETITNAYFSVNQKLKEHYKNKKK